MIDPRTRATMIIVGLFVLVFVINLMRTRKLQERYAILWVLAAVGLVLAPVFIHVIDEMAYALGVEYPPALLLALAVIALMLIILQLSLSISNHADQIKVLTQELGLLRQEVDAMKAKHEADRVATTDAQATEDRLVVTQTSDISGTLTAVAQTSEVAPRRGSEISEV